MLPGTPDGCLEDPALHPRLPAAGQESSVGVPPACAVGSADPELYRWPLISRPREEPQANHRNPHTFPLTTACSWMRKIQDVIEARRLEGHAVARTGDQSGSIVNRALAWPALPERRLATAPGKMLFRGKMIWELRGEH